MTKIMNVIMAFTAKPVLIASLYPDPSWKGSGYKALHIYWLQETPGVILEAILPGGITSPLTVTLW